MLEIALSLAIIGFAVVAIIGILPAGLTVQKENREDTIINQDGPYFLEAIRSGATNLEEIVEHVKQVALVYHDTNGSPVVFRTNFASLNNATTEKVIGLLTTPRGSADPDDPNSNFKIHRVEAEVIALSGVAVEHTHPAHEMSFKYLMVSEVIPFEGSYESWETNSARVENVRSNLFDLRLSFRWPLIVQDPGGTPSFRVPAGGSRKTYRTLVSGTCSDPHTNNLYYFRTGRFVQANKEE